MSWWDDQEEIYRREQHELFEQPESTKSRHPLTLARELRSLEPLLVDKLGENTTRSDKMASRCLMCDGDIWPGGRFRATKPGIRVHEKCYREMKARVVELPWAVADGQRQRWTKMIELMTSKGKL